MAIDIIYPFYSDHKIYVLEKSTIKSSYFKELSLPMNKRFNTMT